MNSSPVREKILLPPTCPAEAADDLIRRHALPNLVASVLCARGITTDEALDTFLNPSLDRLHSPFHFTDMHKACDRILGAVRTNEKICVYGDYDVDGITSISLLMLFFREQSVFPDFYIPNRIEEGYGLSEKAIRSIRDAGTTLLITVDCGITAHKEIALARELGMDVVLTDHHLPLETIPEALAVINPKVAACGYPDADLAGVGVAFKLIQGLTETLYPDPAHPARQEVLNRLDLVSIGTTADIVPLKGENRILVRHGLSRLKQSPCEGIKALLHIAGLYEKPIRTTQVLFQIAPLINAVGRLGDPRTCVEFFTTPDPKKAQAIAAELKRNNIERKALDLAITEECFRRIEADPALKAAPFLVLASEDWHPGVVGIVASRVVEKYHRPACILCVSGDEATGSARSIPGLHAFEAARACQDLLMDFGGHEFAAGVTLKAALLPELARRLNCYAAPLLAGLNRVRTVTTDARVSDLAELDWTLIEWLRKFEPHGPDNREPVFYADNLSVVGSARVVGRDHLKFKVRGGKTACDAIAFKRIDHLSRVNGAAGDLTLAFTAEENEWMGSRSIQLNIRGIE